MTNIVEEMKNEQNAVVAEKTAFKPTIVETELYIRASAKKVCCIPWSKQVGRNAVTQKPMVAELPEDLNCSFSNAVLKYTCWAIANELDKQEKAGEVKDIRLYVPDRIAITAFSYFGALRNGENPLDVLVREKSSAKDIEIIKGFIALMEEVANSGHHVFFVAFRSLLMFDLEVPEGMIIPNNTVVKFNGDTGVYDGKEIKFVNGVHTITRDYTIIARNGNRYFATRPAWNAYNALLSGDTETFESVYSTQRVVNKNILTAMKLSLKLVPNESIDMIFDDAEDSGEFAI